MDVIRDADMPGLPSLAETPMGLRLMAAALPRLATQFGGRSAFGSDDRLTGAASGSVSTAPLPEQTQRMSRWRVQVSRAALYRAFVEHCWEVDTRRLQRAWPAGLTQDFDAPLSFASYCTDLAVEMTARDKVSL